MTPLKKANQLTKDKGKEGRSKRSANSRERARERGGKDKRESEKERDREGERDKRQREREREREGKRERERYASGSLPQSGKGRKKHQPAWFTLSGHIRLQKTSFIHAESSLQTGPSAAMHHPPSLLTFTNASSFYRLSLSSSGSTTLPLLPQ